MEVEKGRSGNLSIRTKVLFGNLIVMICLGIAIVALAFRISSLQREIDFVSGHDLSVHETIGRLEKDMLDMETGMRGFVITGRVEYLEPYRDALGRWETDYEDLKDLTSDNPSQQAKLEMIRSDIEAWLKTAGSQAIAWKEEGRTDKLDSFFAKMEGKSRMDQFRSKIDEFRAAETSLTQERVRELRSGNDTLVLVLYALWAVVAIVSVGVGLMISGTLIRGIRQVAAAIRTIAKEDRGPGARVELKSRDEMRELAEATNELLAKIEKDHLAKERIAEVATLLQGQQDLEFVARSFLDRTARIFGIPYAVLYRLVSSDQLERIASYAADGEEIGRRSFRLGEGLVGQCAREHRLLVVSDLPDSYVAVRSGIGQASPRELVVVPLLSEGQVVGVLEIGAFRPFEPDDLRMLETLAGIVGVSMQSVARQNEIQQLYIEAQAANEELQVQSEELNAQSLELLGMNDELKRISSFKSEFLANMSHELRTPLNSMLILSQMLAENRDNRLSEEDVQYIRTIHSAGSDLLSLINDILDLSKVEAGKLEVAFGPVVLQDVRQAVEDEFNGVAASKRLEFRVAVEDGVPEWFETDGFRLQQIIRNLLSNAFKFTEAGSVSLTIGKRISDVWKTEELAFSVKDTGIGIPKEKFEYIFESFTQADGGTARKFGGTGLGLKISRQLAELLGGRIEVRSEPGEGSEFTLFVPVRFRLSAVRDIAAAGSGASGAARTTALPDREATARLQGKKALLVDDDARNVFALSNLLESFKMEIAVAHDGLECLERLKTEGCDLILMDVMMPDMDGLETIREIRQTLGLAVPILAVTAKAMKEDKEKCLQAGANGYVSKPIQAAELIRAMLENLPES
ncbi:histidine kinase [Cohnella xylanilytica]|uniref:Circadian input-output histidine kinase CikA n=1 Tax=Cohnella xylanilytica TaxID=557555 RepID=A0A841TXQ0_9BACL|nr:CHASE3 domain-containing protein [Cohnella xylanilytica]MBB6692995.1 CHASE3 domain-containing protein [Cohnella xylanilytica]GIO11838.1 histidine kinase [Cohnella xylanilytica]